MIELNLIKSELQHIVESISPIVGAEVAVYDYNYIVIASTLTNKHITPGEKVRGGNVMRYVMRTGQIFINEHPSYSEVCTNCNIKDECMEFAAVTCPIIFHDETIGAISFTAFNNNQKHRILENQKELAAFVDKLSILIASLVAEKELIREKDINVQKLETILSSINDGIIAIDEHGHIINFNKLALQRLSINIEKGKKIPLEIYNRLSIDYVLKTGQPKINKEVRYYDGKSTKGVMISTWPIINLNNVVGAVTVIKDILEIHSLVNQLTVSNNYYTMDDIITNCPIMIRLKEQALRIARSDSTVLITGESGTGKELFSRSIHANSLRTNKPFVAINCAAIPETLLESELFGYEEGAFTGARKNGKPGKIELANGGTLFLDEIGDMPLSLQAKLLRVVEERRLERIGSINQTIIDVRIIAATHRNLEKLIEEREFREDLYFRLNVIPLRIPPLRERTGDINLLLNYYINQFLVLDDQPKHFTEEALRYLNNYYWPGNARELRNCVEYALNTQTGNFITEKDLPHRIIRYNNQNKISEMINKDFEEGCDYGKLSNIQQDVHNVDVTLKEMEITLIERALKRFGKNHDGKVNAAQILGIDVSTLYRKIKKYKI